MSLRKVRKDKPDDFAAWSALPGGLNDYAYTKARAGKFDAAEQACREAKGVCRSQNNLTFELRDLSGKIDYNLALIEINRNHFQEAFPSLKDSIATYRQLVLLQPDVVYYRAGLAKSEIFLAMTYRHLHRLDDAEQLMNSLLGVRKREFALFPGVYTVRHALIDCHFEYCALAIERIQASKAVDSALTMESFLQANRNDIEKQNNAAELWIRIIDIATNAEMKKKAFDAALARTAVLAPLAAAKSMARLKQLENAGAFADPQRRQMLDRDEWKPLVGIAAFQDLKRAK